MKVLRAGVIGMGRIGWQFHAPQICRHDGFELAGVVDPLPQRREEAEREFGAPAYADFDSLLDAEKLDLVVVASPTEFHAPQTIAAFEHGCDVFCDKPAAMSLEELDRMIDASRSHGRKLMVYQPHRAGADTVALQDILRRDLIGPVYMIKRTCSGYTRRNDWQAFKRHGGGMLNNYGAHYIDQVLHLSAWSPNPDKPGCGALPKAKRICCRLRTIASLGDADDVVKAIIETEDGTILDVDINMASAHILPQWWVLGRRGSIVLDEQNKAWKVKYFRQEDLPDLAVQEGLAAEDRRYGPGETLPWKEETIAIGDFKRIDFYQKCYEYYALDAAPFIPIEQTREVMRILAACHKDGEN